MLLDARRFAVQHYSGSGLMCASAQNEIGGQSTLPSSLCAIATPEPPRYQRYYRQSYLIRYAELISKKSKSFAAATHLITQSSA